MIIIGVSCFRIISATDMLLILNRSNSVNALQDNVNCISSSNLANIGIIFLSRAFAAYITTPSQQNKKLLD